MENQRGPTSDDCSIGTGLVHGDHLQMKDLIELHLDGILCDWCILCCSMAQHKLHGINHLRLVGLLQEPTGRQCHTPHIRPCIRHRTMSLTNNAEIWCVRSI